MTYLERDGISLYFGGTLVLSSIEAEPLTYGEDFGGRPLWERTPNSRRVRLEGYIAPDPENTDDCRRSVARLRRMLSGIVNPVGKFTLDIDTVRAILEKGRLTTPRKAPFSGETAEQFIIEAEIAGGYFHGDTVRVSPTEGAEGGTFPVSVPASAGVLDGVSVIRAVNRGDIPAGFTATFSPDTTITSFSLVNPATGQGIWIPASFGSGDRIKICTRRDGMGVTLVRGGSESDISGRCTAESELFALPTGESTLVLGDGATFTGELVFEESFASF